MCPFPLSMFPLSYAWAAPKVNAGIEDEGTASRSVYTRTVDEGERQKALETRKKAPVDLGEIARSSAAVSGSPPTNVRRTMHTCCCDDWLMTCAL